MKREIKISVRSRNFSCAPLKELRFPIKVIYRMGSKTPTEEITNRKKVLEINTVKSCKLSMDKIEMKKRFTRSNIPSSPWFMINCRDFGNERIEHYLKKWKTIIAKHKFSSKGKGIYLITSMNDYDTFLIEIGGYDNLCNYIFEKYYTYSREYRLHITKNGCFHASRKMLKNDAEVRWHRHHNNSIFVKEDSELFDKPSNWDEIVTACVSALKSLELDIAAFDIKVQTSKAESPKFIILESNTAPALGEETVKKYINILTTFVNEKV